MSLIQHFRDFIFKDYPHRMICRFHNCSSQCDLALPVLLCACAYQIIIAANTGLAIMIIQAIFDDLCINTSHARLLDTMPGHRWPRHLWDCQCSC